MYPTIFHFGHLYVPTYGLMAALGIACAMFLSARGAALVGVSADGLWGAGMFAVVAAFVISRALLVLTNLRSFVMAPMLLLAVPSLTASGLLLTAIATLGYLTWKRLPVLRALDAWAPAGMLLWAFLALGHLAEGSDPGLPWRYGLRTSLAGYKEQPVALYVVVAAMALCVGLWKVMRQGWWPAGRIAAAGLVGAGAAQFLLTFLRLPYDYGERTPLALLDPLQWVALGMVVAGGLMWAGTDAWPRKIHREASMHAMQKEL